MGKMKDRLIEDMELHPESYSEDASDYMSEEELRFAMGGPVKHKTVQVGGYNTPLTNEQKDNIKNEQMETLRDKLSAGHTPTQEELDQEDKE